MFLSLPDLFGDGKPIVIIHVLLAAAVTIHVLLRKQSVRASIGWIGLAWLSPIFGAVFYFILGINRVERRAARFRRAEPGYGSAPAKGPEVQLPENIAVIARVVEQLTGRAMVGGNSVTLLRSGDGAYPAMLDAIRAAQRSIVLASYIFRADDAGRAFIEALAEAHARGVQVRVLIDGIGGGYVVSRAAHALRKKDVPVARFLHYWLPWRMPYLNMRSHKKILVVDGAVGFTGGMNIGSDNVLAGHPPNPVRDIHFRVDGPVVRQLMETFAEDWNFTTGERLDDEIWWPDLPQAGPVWARGIGSGPDEAVGRLESILLAAVSGAKDRLRIVTPYFLPDEHLMAAIQLAALRGVAVDIVVPQRSDHVLIDWAMRAHLALLAPSINIHLAPGPFSHAKLMTVDGEWSLIGSANWDVRSTRLNFEFSLECYDAALNTEIDRVVDARVVAAPRVSSEEIAVRPLPVRLRDAAARLLLPYL